MVHASLLGSAGDSDDQALPKGLSLLCFVWSRCLTSQPVRGSVLYEQAVFNRKAYCWQGQSV